MILDGWGISQPFGGNAIALAKTPFFDSLVTRYPSMTLSASGESVGLPWGEEGNSEVGHLNMGAGRIIYQNLPKINRAIADHSFYKNKALMEAVEHAKKNDSAFHIIGLCSTGGVHASLDHFHALLVLAKENNLSKVFIHVILDGRDTPFNSGLNFVMGIERAIEEYGIGEIATISGRFYAMDRNNNWDRTEKAYLAMTEGVGNKGTNAQKIIQKSYKNKIYDEEFIPSVIYRGDKPVSLISDNDSVIFFNYRPDRARQITKAFVIDDLDKFSKKRNIENLKFVTFTEYEKGLPVDVVFHQDYIKNTLGEIISKNKLKQLRIAETEKYAHVTYFFNGGVEDKLEGEDHILIPSPNVSSYDEVPEMSAPEVTKKIIEQVEADTYDFIVVNFANPDMVGHTSNIEATIKAVETLDILIKKIIGSILDKDGVIILTADHGNAEYMFDMQTGMKVKEHSSNPVPCILIGSEYEGKTFGWQDTPNSDLSLLRPQGVLADLAPTILNILKIDIPKEMTGRSLL